MTLPLGVAYTCLFWAQYIPNSGGGSEFFDTDDLKAVALKKALTAEDQCQAFCATASVAAADEALTQTVVMKRAVAQVNIKSDTQMTGYSKLTAAYTNVPNTFNVLDNTVTVPLPEVSKELVVQEELWGKCRQSLQSPPAKIPER